MGKKNDWKKREGVVYSTDTNFDFQTGTGPETETLPPAQQLLRIRRDTSGRAGKVMTIVSGFVGTTADLEMLGKKLKAGCGTGGSVKDAEILIQGDVGEKVRAALARDGYRVR